VTIVNVALRRLLGFSVRRDECHGQGVPHAIAVVLKILLIARLDLRRDRPALAFVARAAIGGEFLA